MILSDTGAGVRGHEKGKARPQEECWMALDSPPAVKLPPRTTWKEVSDDDGSQPCLGA